MVGAQPRHTRALYAISGLAILTVIGTAGYVYLEDLPWFQALYMTVVTISTVGYGDFVPVTAAGQLFTTVLIACGAGAALYLLSVIAEEVLEGSLRDLYQRSAMMRKIEGLSGHVLVCGFGRFGRVVVEELMRAGRSVVVVECDAALEPDLVRAGVEFVIGSATVDEVLVTAGVERAEALVVATSGEAESVFISLSARELRPDIKIHARGETSSGIRRLRRAGADFVASPYQMGGVRTAASILRPSVVDFLELSTPHRSDAIDLEEVRAGANSKIVGRTISEIEQGSARLRVVAPKHLDEPTVLIPDPTERVEVDDHLVVIGGRDELERLARRALAEDASGQG